jgi:hypothetical protein
MLLVVDGSAPVRSAFRMSIGSSLMVVLGASVLLALACCTKSARDAGTPLGQEPNRSSSTASMSPVAAPSGPADDCIRACGMLAECDAAETRDCPSRCAASPLHQRGQLHCLASRILWIDEDGCGSMLDTYRRFDPEDDCVDPQPTSPVTPRHPGEVSPL